MDGKQFAMRARLVLAVMVVVFATFVGVLYNLQIVRGAELREQSTRKVANTETVQAARGQLLDSYGRVLVSNQASYQVVLETRYMGQDTERNETLLRLMDICRDQEVEWNDSLSVSVAAPFLYTRTDPLGTKEEKTQLGRYLNKAKLKGLAANPTATQLIDALRTYFKVDEDVDAVTGRALVGVLYDLDLRSQEITYSKYVFAEKVGIELITAIKEASLPGVKIETTTVRQYQTTYAAHLLGSVGAIQNWDDYKDKGYAMNDTVGVDGMEKAFEDLLRGTPGTKDVELNQSGKVISSSWQVDLTTGEEKSPKPGSHVITTVDLKLQEAVEQALARHVPGMTKESEGAACVVMDMTAGVLAMGSYPTYDLANFRKNWNELSTDPLKPLLNRAVQGLYAPGSTIKMAVATGGLEEGVITRTEKIRDTGRYLHYDRIQDQPMCWIYRQSRRTHGLENVSEAIRDSCNVYFYETGLRLGIEKLDAYAALFGLGRKTGLELFEETGEVAGPETSAKHEQSWYEGETMYAAIGQGNTQVTPIQLANYMVTLVNGGTHYKAHLLKEVKSSDFSQVVEEYQPEVLDQLDLDPKNVEAVKLGMGMVASEGSAASYFRHLPVKVGAKTGSAQVPGYNESNAIMVAFAPYDNPEIAVGIVVEHGGSGSNVAAIAADIFEYYFSAKGGLDAPAVENTLVR